MAKMKSEAFETPAPSVPESATTVTPPAAPVVSIEALSATEVLARMLPCLRPGETFESRKRNADGHLIEAPEAKLDRHDGAWRARSSDGYDVLLHMDGSIEMEGGLPSQIVTKDGRPFSGPARARWDAEMGCFYFHVVNAVAKGSVTVHRRVNRPQTPARFSDAGGYYYVERMDENGRPVEVRL